MPSSAQARRRTQSNCNPTPASLVPRAQVSPAFFMFFLQAEHTMSHCARSKRF
jgi:hypothetical protein